MYSFTEKIPACNDEQFNQIASQLQQVYSFFDTVQTANEYDEIYILSNALSIRYSPEVAQLQKSIWMDIRLDHFLNLFCSYPSDPWFGCQTLVDRQFVRSEVQIVTELTLRCPFDDPSFNATDDPCCNVRYSFSNDFFYLFLYLFISLFI